MKAEGPLIATDGESVNQTRPGARFYHLGREDVALCQDRGSYFRCILILEFIMWSTSSSYAYSASERERVVDAHANTCTVRHVGKRKEDKSFYTAATHN